MDDTKSLTALERFMHGMATNIDKGLGRIEEEESPVFMGVEHLRAPGSYRDFAESQLFLKDRESGDLVRFAFNWIQQEIDIARLRAIKEGRRPWFIILKYRRGGVTSWAQGLAFHRIWSQQHRKCLTLSHRDKDTREIFEMGKSVV